MTTFTQAQGARTSIFTIGTLASDGWLTSSAIDLTATLPMDVTLELECNPNGTPTGRKQLKLLATFSLDGVNYGTGGSSLNDELQLQWIGALPTYTTAIAHRKFFSMQGLPVARYMKLVAHNDMGVALSSGAVYMAAITGVST